ncbi:hypothetical protein H4Q32_019577 [Labeo rohita]|uniref:SURP motif domain-containing protein n=1 Tax=Labeo rohita TaxID=84645 RepID=A0ABQ8LLD0_LABRO|nr:hypothetical protein H4Q32_019577 [Labeo rohita]
MYYGYCMLPDGTYCLAPPPPGIDASPYYTSMPTGMMPAPPASGPPPPPGTTPSLDPAAAIPSAPAAGPVTVSAPASAPLSHSAPAAPPTSSSRPPQTTVAPTVPAAAAPVAAIIPPPPDIQPVIDKLAEYVARNGVKFESSVRAKNDLRFDFLQSWHQYNSYYEFKKHYFMQKEGLSLQEEKYPYFKRKNRCNLACASCSYAALRMRRSDVTNVNVPLRNQTKTTEAFIQPPEQCEAVFIKDGNTLLGMFWIDPENHLHIAMIELGSARTIFNNTLIAFF